MKLTITKELYGKTAQGKNVHEYTMVNENGTSVKIIEYGCAITQINVKDRFGVMRDVVLGYDGLNGYEKGNAGHGSFIGRYANRLEGACFTLMGKEFKLTANNNGNFLHGSFSHKIFKAAIDGDSLVLKLKSKDGEDGFPGDLNVCVTYTLTNEDTLVMDYTAITNEPTIINLTNHSYFNLDGQGSGDILDTVLELDADSITQAKEDLCPTGKILPVKGTEFDFTVPKTIGQDINADCEQIKIAGGYDHNFIFNKEEGMLAKVGVAKSEKSGIKMTLFTTQPAVQLYTGNFLGKEDLFDKNGKPFVKHTGFCLETQHYPCSPMHEHFPSVTLMPEEEYHQTTIYAFDIE